MPMLPSSMQAGKSLVGGGRGDLHERGHISAQRCERGGLGRSKHTADWAGWCLVSATLGHSSL